MDERGMTENDAYSWHIQQTAMRERRTMRDVATDVLPGAITP